MSTVLSPVLPGEAQNKAVDTRGGSQELCPGFRKGGECSGKATWASFPTARSL